MSDLELIFLVLAGFYLWECAYWLRPGAVVFAAPLGRGHRARTVSSGALLFNAGGGLVPGHLLPIGNSLCCEQWPLSLSPDGAFGWVQQGPFADGRPSQTGAYWPWDKIQSIATDARQVMVNGMVFIRVSSKASAQHFAGLLRRLKDTAPDRRAALIDQAMTQCLAAEEIARRFQQTHEASRYLQITCWVLFGYLFLYGPSLLLLEIPVSFMQLLRGYAGLLAVALAHFAHIHGRLHAADDSEPTRQLAAMLISPADAIHARDSLFHDLLVGFHPVAVALVLCRQADFLAMARRAWLDMAHPLPAPQLKDRPAARAAAGWFHERLRKALEDFLRANKIDPDAFLASPLPETAECRSYCPRCRGQYILEVGTCHGCGLALVNFSI